MRARQELVRFQLIASPEDFLGARCAAVTGCYFANCLGNNYLDRECDIFAATLTAFRDRHLEVLVGVSVKRGPESYHTSWYDFLLQTPNYLKASVGLLRAVGEEKLEGKYKEFVLPQGDKEQDVKLRNERCPPAKPEPY